MTKIYLTFVDDWELRGDGTGDPTQLQFRPLRELTRLFEERSIHGSFNAEVMQQIAFRLFQEGHPHLRHWADEWETTLTDAFRRGHDFQLHLHPQWTNASYDGKRWQLTAPWSILEHTPENVSRMLDAGINLLESLLKPIRPNYRCISFRAGSWCIAPSQFVLDLLASRQIHFDMSVVKGAFYNVPVKLDYRNVQEGFFPYYPDMQDARRVSSVKEPIVCVPTNSFPETPAALLRRGVSKIVHKALGDKKPANGRDGLASTSDTSYGAWVEEASLSTRLLRRLRTCLLGRWTISDIAQLNYSQLSSMLGYIRRVARRSGLPEVPVILENHTKDITDFSNIERFLDEVAASPDIQCVTTTELDGMLQAGRFPIRTISRNAA